jgi:hypothetical protein
MQLKRCVIAKALYTTRADQTNRLNPLTVGAVTANFAVFRTYYNEGKLHETLVFCVVLPFATHFTIWFPYALVMSIPYQLTHQYIWLPAHVHLSAPFTTGCSYYYCELTFPSIGVHELYSTTQHRQLIRSEIVVTYTLYSSSHGSLTIGDTEHNALTARIVKSTERGGWRQVNTSSRSSRIWHRLGWTRWSPHCGRTHTAARQRAAFKIIAALSKWQRFGGIRKS